SVDRTFLPGVKSVLLEAATALWEGRSNFISEAHFRTLDGRPLVAIMSMPVPTTEEEARRVPVSFVDVTARKAMEEELALERRRLQEIIWGTNVGTWEWNVQTGAVTVNERWAEMVGYTIAELSPISIATWTGLAHPDDLKASEAQLAQVFAGALDRYECEVRMRHRNGDFIWVLDRGKVIERDADGRPLRMSGTHTDVTQRKRAEAKAARLAAIRELILRCDRVILREPDETRLLRRLVEMLVESRGYAFVWIGVPRQDAERSVEPVAWAGAAAAFLEGVTVHWSDDAFSQGPTARAIKTGSPQTIRSIADAPGLAHIADAAARWGLVSVIALPILVQGRVDAVLSAFSVHADSFDEDETALLLEFAANLGLAMQTRRTEAENEQFRLQLDRAALGAINAVAATLEKRDPYTSGHQERVARLSVAIATELGWERSRIEGLRLGAMIHDIGKISVPSEILNRPGRLTASELAIIKAHPQVGYEILEKSDFPWPIRDMIHQHHERLDGSGYPQGLTGERIIAEAKVIAVADVLEAISSHRPYRPALGLDAALREIEGGRGTIYDAEIVDVCVRLVRDRGFRWESPDPAAADLATR
ncbi:MAG: PAS domain-containing protein, partial [Alphaproteobacteria bacterium]|nr:PAS domain-containing protein [Alphaproteobacteria bacterium]